jgi:uncharacterized membrane protein
MYWRQRYAVASYARSSVWLVPFAAFAASFAIIRLLGLLDSDMRWTWSWRLEVPVVQNVLEGFVAAMLSFIVFTSSSLLVAIQIASAQLTPRIIATALLRDNTIRGIIALFVLTLAFNLGVLARAQSVVPYLLFTFAVGFTIASVTAFLYLIDYAARLLRPVTIVWRLGDAGLKVVDEIYPSRVEGGPSNAPAMPVLLAPAREVGHAGRSGIVLACDIEALREEASRTGGVVEFACRVGDFVATGETIFRLHGAAAGADIDRLRGSVALGRERTIEQDVTFAFRVIVDIAVKALSRAINDPTTAVLAIDQLHRLLRSVGRRHLHDDIIPNARGAAGVVFRTPDWKDFVELSCREIRLYGVENFQVARRLRAMLENLLRTLPERRAPALQRELDLLDRAIDLTHAQPEDRALCRVPDLQGLGSSPHRDDRDAGALPAA